MSAVETNEENQGKLNTCSRHEFKPYAYHQGTELPQYYRCTKCLGLLEAELAQWYERGLEHGQRAGNHRQIVGII